MKTLTKKKTHIATIRQQNQNGMQQVCHFLQCSEQDYCDYLFQQYCLFVEELYKGFPDSLIRKILYSPIFRGMFNNAAAMRDEAEFITYAADVTEDITAVNDEGQLVVSTGIPLGGDYLIDAWTAIHSFKSLIHDDEFINQFKYTLNLIKIL